MLPFTADVFFSNLAHYNQAIWPAPIVGQVLALAVLLLVLLPAGWNSRLIAFLLAAAWVWVGVVYHLMHFATVNFAAPLFGAAFVIEGLLLAWAGVATQRISFRFHADPAGWTGLVLVLFALVEFPLLGWSAGHGWLRLVGTASGPTVIFTIGMLLLAKGRTPLYLMIIPVLWSLAAGTAAWKLEIREDIALPVAGVVGLALVLWKNRSAA
jgi:hypothetical protein